LRHAVRPKAKGDLWRICLELLRLGPAWTRCSKGLPGPGHFQGVVNVVERLFHYVRPMGFFGEKGPPATGRDTPGRYPIALARGHHRMPHGAGADGLALSSRNPGSTPPSAIAPYCTAPQWPWPKRLPSGSLEEAVAGRPEHACPQNPPWRWTTSAIAPDGRSAAPVRMGNFGRGRGPGGRTGGSRALDRQHHVRPVSSPPIRPFPGTRTLMTIEVLPLKIHRITVTEANVDYIGSITLDRT
jgi:hypothetical protein